MPTLPLDYAMYLLLGLGIPAIALLILIFRSGARTGASGATKLAPRVFSGFGVVLALGVAGFIGSMIVTISGVSFPQVVQIADPLVCEGTVNSDALNYSYKPGQKGVNRSFTCDAGDGTPPRVITLSLLAAAAAIYSAAAFVLLLVPVLLLGRLLPQLGASLRAKKSVVAGVGGTTVGTAALQDLLRNHIQSTPGDGSSTSEVKRTWVVVNNDKSPNPAIAALQDALLESVDQVAFDAVMSAHPHASGDPAERLGALESLHEKGLLTASEYQAKRAEILSQL